MIKRQKRLWQLSGTVLLMLILAGSAYAFTAANVVSPSRAGDGSGAINGYTISNLYYTLDNADPQNIQSVTFTLNANASSLYVSLTGGAPYLSCGAATGGVAKTCTFSSEPSVGAATSLRVIAAQ